MAQPENKEEKRRVSPLWPMAVSFLILIYVVYVLLFMSKGWFSQKRDVTGQGNGVGVMDVADITVYNVERASDTDEIDRIRDDYMARFPNTPREDVTADDLALTITLDAEDTEELLMPGAHGQFTAYIKTTASRVYSTLTPALEYSTATDVGDKLRLEATAYAGTHIAFFKSCATATDVATGRLVATYSDWIPVNTAAEWSVADLPNGGNGSKAMTVYWLWIKEYAHITGTSIAPPSPIGQADRQQILAAVEQAPASWFSGTQLDTEPGRTNAYNSADMAMAFALKKIGFTMGLRAS